MTAVDQPKGDEIFEGTHDRRRGAKDIIERGIASFNLMPESGVGADRSTAQASIQSGIDASPIPAAHKCRSFMRGSLADISC